MHDRAVVYFAVFLTLLAAGCRRETPDEDMVAASETTATTDTAGTLSGTTTRSTAGTVSAMSPADKEFVIQAAGAGAAEVMLSEPALQKGSAGVREFAQRMITDHGRGSEELQTLALNKGLALPTALDRQQQNALDALQKATGAEFDRAYIARMVEDHQKAVSDFENAERTLQDPEVRAWVSRTLPALRQHLKQAQELQGKVR